MDSIRANFDSAPAGEDLVAGRFVRLVDGELFYCTVNTQEAYGVTTAATKTGALALVAVEGQADVECASGSIIKGNPVMTNATGQAIPYVAGAGVLRQGKSLEAGIAPSGGKFGFVRVILPVFASI